MWWYQSGTSLWRHPSSVHFNKACGLCVYTVIWGSKQNFNKAELWTLGRRSTLIIFSFSSSVADLQGCLGPLSWCAVQFQPSFSCHTDGVTFDSKVLYFTDELMVNWIRGPKTNHAWQLRMRPFCWDTVFWLLINAAVCIVVKRIHFGHVCPKDIIPQIL